MLHESTNLSLSLLILVSGATCIGADYTARRYVVYLFKPLTMLLVLVIALQSSTSAFYQEALLAGLLFSLAGDVFLMLPSDRFALGLASFLVAHLCYIAAFATDASLAASAAALLPFAVAAAIVYRLLWPKLGRLKIAVLAYVVVIVVMAWQATLRWLVIGEPGALLACIGASLFVISDGALAINRFHRPFRAAQALVLGTYFTAQWLIALSIGVGEALIEWSLR
jgi:uncharacterized membrane protein YhhN